MGLPMRRSNSVLPFLCALLFSFILSACGGGGGDNDQNNQADINGTWVFADGGHYSGTACGLDAYGDQEFRDTLVLNGTTFTYKFEQCNLTTPTTGTFVTVGTQSGTFVAGEAYATDGGYELKKLDITYGGVTYYIGYNITGDKLRFAIDEPGYDGSSDAKRARKIDPDFYKKQ